MKYSPEQLSQQTNLFLKLLSVERNLSNRTLKAYRSDLQCFMLWCKNTQIETLDQNTILSYFHYLQTTLERKASSIQRKYISIRQFFQYMNQEGISAERFSVFPQGNSNFPKQSPVFCQQRRSAPFFFLQTLRSVSLKPIFIKY